MDPQLLSDFRSCLVDLQQNKPGHGEDKDNLQIPQQEFLDGLLNLVIKKDDIAIERYQNLLEVTGVKPPLLLACKNDSFWQSTEMESDKSLQFVNVRRKKKKSSVSSYSDQSSLDGSPMKLDQIADLSLDDADVSVLPARKKSAPDCAVPIATARKLVLLYTTLFHSMKDEVAFDTSEAAPTLVVVCNGRNIKSASGVCLQPILDKQNNIRGVKNTVVKSKAAANKSSQMKIVPSFGRCDITCEARYDILTEVTGKYLSLELRWRKLPDDTCVLLHDPPMDARSTIKMSTMHNNTRSPAFSLFRELEILRSVIEGISTTQVHWVGVQERPLVDAVRDLVEQLKLGSDVVKYKMGDNLTDGDENEEDISVSDNFDTSLLEERKDLDFTDHLWKILQNCTSYSDLLETFRFILAMLRDGDLQPYVHHHNISTVAQMVRDSYRGQLRPASLAGLAPLEYLAEMGVHKLTQDYIHVFLSRSLMTIDNLNFFIRDNVSLSERLEYLGRLQKTLEVIIFLKQCLNLPLSTLSDSSKAMLKHFETNAVDPNHQFVFSVPTAAVAGIIEKYPVSKWKAEGVTLVDGVAQRLVYHFTREQPFDWLKLESHGTSGGSVGDEEECYYLTVLEDSVSILG